MSTVVIGVPPSDGGADNDTRADGRWRELGRSDGCSVTSMDGEADALRAVVGAEGGMKLGSPPLLVGTRRSRDVLRDCAAECSCWRAADDLLSVVPFGVPWPWADPSVDP